MQKFSLKYLQTKIQEHTKNIIHYDKVEFILEMQGSFHRDKFIKIIYKINTLKDKAFKTISLYGGKAFYSIQNIFMLKSWEIKDAKDITQHNKNSL